jgi:undecaprenyl-diphosphatase
MKHRPPPPGKGEPEAQSYPSGHALETTAVALATGWVLVREEIAPAWAVVPVALTASLVSTLGRLVLDRHWSSDSVGGTFAGATIGTAAAAIYEAARQPARRARW